jgi:hypothetical protein
MKHPVFVTLFYKICLGKPAFHGHSHLHCITCRRNAATVMNADMSNAFRFHYMLPVALWMAQCQDTVYREVNQYFHIYSIYSHEVNNVLQTSEGS